MQVFKHFVSSVISLSQEYTKDGLIFHGIERVVRLITVTLPLGID